MAGKTMSFSVELLLKIMARAFLFLRKIQGKKKGKMTGA